LLMLKRNERSELRPTIVANWTRLLKAKNK